MQEVSFEIHATTRNHIWKTWIENTKSDRKHFVNRAIIYIIQNESYVSKRATRTGIYQLKNTKYFGKGTENVYISFRNIFFQSFATMNE